jgi:hypothetical protein
VSKDERKAKRAADKALYRSLATQLLMFAISDTGKPARYLLAAELADQVAARLRERASE